MAISFRKYVDITSGIGAGAAVRRRDLILRLFTSNPLVPTKTLIEFDDAESVLAYFGAGSEEYKRAVFYFAWISKNITRAKKLGFARWTVDSVAAQIYGSKDDKVLGDFASVSDASLKVTVDGDLAEINGLDLSGAASLTAVAALIETAIQAIGGDQFTTATVVYNATRNSFDFEAGTVGAAVISTADGSGGTNITGLLGWSGTGAILSDGAAAETITETLTESSDASNNFGTYAFIDTLTLSELTEAATWNSTQNVLFMLLAPVTDALAASYYAALANYQGVALTLSETTDEFPELIPGIILAATNYGARNSVQNYMYQIFNVTPAVKTTTKSNALDALRVNYYGQTQTAGQLLEFYQRGVLMGLPVNPVDMNVYANEQWLKDAAGASIMELLLSLAKVSANAKGRVQLISQLQSIIGEATTNGVISIGKTLSNTQKLYIAEITGDAEAWRQIQTIGYWLDCNMVSYVTEDSRTEWKAVYTLVYSKDDIVRKVEGSHVLI